MSEQRLLLGRHNLNLLKSDRKRKDKRAKVGEFSPFGAWERKLLVPSRIQGNEFFLNFEFVVIIKRS